MADLTVACVMRSGGLYDESWVAKLRRGVERHLTVPHDFVCVSDVAMNVCPVIELQTNWPGWWSKIELFRPGLFAGPVLYFDLDTVVVGSLDAMATWPHAFTMGHEYYRPAFKCSTAMAWRGDYSEIWHKFAAAPDRIQRQYVRRADHRIGDQAFIEDVLEETGQPVATFADLFGECSVASYKVHGCAQRPPADAAVVAFHGSPKPHDLKSGWVASTWV